MKNYTQSEDMADLVDWDAIMPMRRSAGGHDEQMRSLFRGATVLAHYNCGDYQGEVATIVKLQDGRVAAYCDYYGSCSGCDSWEDSTDADARKLCTDLARSAYVWANEGDARSWFRWVVAGGKPDGYQWAKAAVPLFAVWRNNEADAIAKAEGGAE